MVGTGLGAKHGILFKNATALEILGKTGVVVFDKTGTLTKGTPFVTDVICVDSKDDTELLTIAHSLEIKSEHPLAKAVTDKAKSSDILPLEASDFKVATPSIRKY